MDRDIAARLRVTYEDLHAHPELAGHEVRTAGIVAGWLRDHGYRVHDGIGGTGVVGVLTRGDGPCVLLRADMDALPVAEQTGLAYASAVDGVMHACGHDLHTVCLMGAAATLADPTVRAWTGTVVLVFQPAEETVTGARAMLADGLYEIVPRPDVVLGQHVAPLPAGTIGLRSGPSFAATDALRITLFGRGGHGSRPEATVDPVVMAAATIQRLQGIVSREVAGTETAVVTVGAVHAGTVGNVIPESAELLVSVRSYTPAVRATVLDAIARIVAGESQASGAPRPGVIQTLHSAPAVVNDAAAAERVRAALEGVVGAGRVVDPGPITGSEDVGEFADAASAPIVYWLLGGADPARFVGADSVGQVTAVVAGLPSNHSPLYYPTPDPTIGIGIRALTAAAWEQLAPAAPPR